MDIQYHMITAAANIESLGEMKWVHSAFIQLYVSEVADMLHVFNIKCKHGRNIILFLPLWDNNLNTVRSRKYTKLNEQNIHLLSLLKKPGMVICLVNIELRSSSTWCCSRSGIGLLPIPCDRFFFCTWMTIILWGCWLDICKLPPITTSLMPRIQMIIGQFYALPSIKIILPGIS